ncbi:MAG: FG-GAP-like repeat-containing protein, partial [Chloroflexota bacterium]
PMVFLNDGGDFGNGPVWIGDINQEEPLSIDWGDMDQDGLPELAAGTVRGDYVFYNQGGTLENEPIWSDEDEFRSDNILWGDADGDGDYDLVTANQEEGIKINFNEAGFLAEGRAIRIDQPFETVLSDPFISEDQIIPIYPALEFEDLNQDGLPDLVAPLGSVFLGREIASVQATDGKYEIFIEPISTVPVISESIYFTDLVTGLTSVAPAITPTVFQDEIEFTYAVNFPNSNTRFSTKAYFKFPGSGGWIEALPTDGTTVDGLRNGVHAFVWDVNQSDFFGSSQEVLFQIEAIPSTLPESGFIAGDFEYPVIIAETGPLRVQGSQLQVLFQSSPTETIPVDNALIFKREAGSGDQSRLISDAQGIPYRTDIEGLLQGSGQIENGDLVVPLIPITTGNKIDLYLMGAAPTEDGLAEIVLNDSDGLREIVVSGTHQLMLLNLSVSLEWDASNDPDYLERLIRDLERTSEIIFDLTNGQAALGDVEIFMDKVLWETADIQILADNTHRPNAAYGGIVTEPISDTLGDGSVVPGAIVPGQIRMAATWSRYGTPGGTLGEDWPRTLAHEIGHYAFFQLDNYLGVNASGQLITPECPGSAMTDNFRPDYSEFLGETINGNGNSWDKNGLCNETIAQLSTGRSDWESVLAFYPFLSDNISATGTGPNRLPLALTGVEIFYPEGNSNPPLSAPVFYTQDENQNTLAFNRGEARVYLLRSGVITDTGDDDIILLGSPSGQAINARGAAPGDRLCVFDES